MTRRGLFSSKIFHPSPCPRNKSYLKRKEWKSVLQKVCGYSMSNSIEKESCVVFTTYGSDFGAVVVHRWGLCILHDHRTDLLLHLSRPNYSFLQEGEETALRCLPYLFYPKHREKKDMFHNNSALHVSHGNDGVTHEKSPEVSTLSVWLPGAAYLTFLPD